MSRRKHWHRKLLAACCGLGAALIGALSLLGWLINSTTLISFKAGYKAIAPSISLGLIILGLSLPSLAKPRLSRNERIAWIFAIGLFFLLGSSDVLGALFHHDFNYEDAWTNWLTQQMGYTFTPMSPIAGGLLALTSLGLIFYLLPLRSTSRTFRPRKLATILGTCTALIGGIFVLGYLFREPFMYGSGWIPIAAPAAAGFILLGIGLTALTGTQHWPLAMFFGTSTETRLARAYVPLVILTVLLSSVLVLYHWDLEVNHALVAGFFASVAAIIAALVSSRVARVIGHAIDTAQAARLRAEHEYAEQARLLDTIVENTEAHLVYLDRDFNFIRVNTPYARTCGYEPEEMVGLNHFDLYPHEENEAIFRRVRDTGIPFQIREKPFEFPDQPERGVTYWDWTLSPVKDAAGAVQGLVFALNDVTESVRQRERLLETERARVRLAQTMVSEIAHRTKNNLQIVAGLLQIQAINRADHAPGEAHLLREAVSRIQSFAALHEQMYGMGAEAVNITDVIQRIVYTSCQTLTEDEVAVIFEGEPVICPARAGTNLCVVMSELITNAIKYGGAGPAGRQLRLQVSLAQGKLRFALWNSGNPVPADFATSASTGVGLDVIQSIVADQYGGSFSLSPQEDGTLALVELDFSRIEAEANL